MGKKSSLASDSEPTVFIETSLGTHLAVTVHHDDSVSALKRKIEYEHQLCFTSIGKIIVEALKVKRKGYFYHLSDSMLVKNAFSGVSKNWFLSADASDVPRERLSNVDGSVPLLLEGNENAKEKVTFANQNGLDGSAREPLKFLEIGVKHSYNDHCTTSFHETIDRPEPEIREDHSEGYRVPTTQEFKEDSLRKESDVQCNASSGKALEIKRQLKSKQKAGHLNQNDVSVHEFGKEQSQPDIIPAEILGNQSRDVPCDMATGKNITKEPCRSSASTMDNRSDSGICRTNDTHKETGVPGKHIESRKNASVEDASQSQPAAKKMRKFESIAGLEDPLKENNVLTCDSNNDTSKPEIASFSLGDKEKNENAILDSLTAESSDFLTNCSSRKKKKRKTSSHSHNQVVVAAPSGRDDMEERSLVAAATGINAKNSGGEVVASIAEQGLLGLTPPRLGGISSVDINNTIDAGNVECKSGAAEDIVKVPSVGGADGAERVGEERESSQRKDSELMMSEKHKLPGQDIRHENDTKVSVPSKSLDANGTVSPKNARKKKKKTRKTYDSMRETQIETGAEPIKGSEHGISLDEPHEAVIGEHAGDKAKKEETSLSQKNGKDATEKETESSHFVRKSDKLDGNEVGTLEQIGKAEVNVESMKHNTKKKSKRKQSATTKNLPNLQAELENVGHQDPALTADNRAEVADISRNSELEKTTPLEQLNGEAPESVKDCGVETDSVPARSNSMSIEATKAPSHAPESDKLEVVASGEVQDEEVTGTNRADNKPKAQKKRKKLDAQSISPSSDRQISLKPNEYQGIGGKYEASSGEVQEEEVTGTNRVDNKPKAQKKRKKLDAQSISLQISLKPNEIQGTGGEYEVASGEVQEEEVSGTLKADNKPKGEKKGRKLDVHSSIPSSVLQNSLKSNENQGIGGKHVADNSSSIQPQGSSSKCDGVMPHPEKKFPKKVPKTGTKAPSSHISGKVNPISEAAENHGVASASGTNPRAGKKNEASSVSNPKLKRSNNKANQNKMGNKLQSSVNQNRVGSGKASGIDYGEVVNSSQNKKSSATSRAIFKDDSSGSSEDEDDVVVSEGSTQTPSDYSSSSANSDGESNAYASSPRNGKAGGRSIIKSCSSAIKDLKWNELAKSSSTFKKAKLTASQSQLEDDESQPTELVPDSQPIS